MHQQTRVPREASEVCFLTASQSGHGNTIKVYKRTLFFGRFLSISKQLGIYQFPQFSDCVLKVWLSTVNGEKREGGMDKAEKQG